MTKTTAPSPKTRPLRLASNGRLASVGESLWVDAACMAFSPANITGVMAASTPPAMTTSASPVTSMVRASSRA